MATKDETQKGTECREVIPFPKDALPKVLQFRNQIVEIQAQLQNFVDGVLIGMGIPADEQTIVDFEAMTIAYPKKEQTCSQE
jgi:hypothetical protein